MTGVPRGPGFINQTERAAVCRLFIDRHTGEPMGWTEEHVGADKPRVGLFREFRNQHGYRTQREVAAFASSLTVDGTVIEVASVDEARNAATTRRYSQALEDMGIQPFRVGPEDVEELFELFDDSDSDTPAD